MNLNHTIIRQEFIGKVRVSTIYLRLPGISEHFETMVFGLDDEEFEPERRCSTVTEAIFSHENAVRYVLNHSSWWARFVYKFKLFFSSHMPAHNSSINQVNNIVAGDMSAGDIIKGELNE